MPASFRSIVCGGRGTTLLSGLTVLWMSGCATRGPTHLYLAASGAHPIEDRALESADSDRLAGFLEPADQVIGLGYEFNTDYVWLRLAPGNRLITIKRGIGELWYDYTLPDEFLMAEKRSGDLAGRSFNRMVYAAMPSAGEIGKVERYGEVNGTIRPGDEMRTVGGLAWDQHRDRLLVLYVEDAEVVAYANEIEPVARVTFDVAVQPTTLAYDSNRQRYYVPLTEAGWLGEFDAEGRLMNRLPFPDAAAAIDAGQRSTVRMF